MAPEYAEAFASLILTDWQFKIKKAEMWQKNAIFCQGLNLGLHNPGAIDGNSTSSDIPKIDLTQDDESLDDNIDDTDDESWSFLNQPKIAASDPNDQSGHEEMVKDEDEGSSAVTSNGQDSGEHEPGHVAVPEARAVTNSAPRAHQDELAAVRVEQMLSSSTSQVGEQSLPEEDWPSWTGM